LFLFCAEKRVGGNAEFFVNKHNAVVARLLDAQKPLAYCSLVYAERVGKLWLAKPIALTSGLAEARKLSARKIGSAT